MEQIRVYCHAGAQGGRGGEGLRAGQELLTAAGDVARRFAADRKARRVAAREIPFDDDMCDAVHRRTEPLREQCEALVVLAPPAVALGVRALQRALNPPTYNLKSDRLRSGPQLFVLDDAADPDEVRAVLDLLGPRVKRAFVHAADPVGDSSAVAAHLAIFADAVQAKAGKKYKDRLLVTTCPGPTPLRQVAVAEGLKLLDNPAGATGIDAMFSPAVLFAVEMCGIDIDGVLEGARDMDKQCREPHAANNPAAVLAAATFGGAGGRHVTASPSHDALCEWAAFALPWSGTLVIDVERFAHRLSVPEAVRKWPTFGPLGGSDLQTLTAARTAAAERAALESGRP
ncbi:MAG TPA: hypothetical protein VK324_13400, partial [Tepidisphaeraceae bacterium]|nr:hypothetical protein [Tepidisphaeraceae bacterium]